MLTCAASRPPTSRTSPRRCASRHSNRSAPSSPRGPTPRSRPPRTACTGSIAGASTSTRSCAGAGHAAVSHGRARAAHAGAFDRDWRDQAPPRSPSSVAVVVPVKDGARYLASCSTRSAREAVDEVLVIDSGLARRFGRRSPARAGVDGARDRAGGVRPRPHAQPRRRAHERRRDRVPHAGRDAGARLARRAARGVRARRPTSAPCSARTSRAPDTSPMIARELTEFFADVRARRRAAARASAPATRRSSRTSTRLPPRLLGRDPLRRRPLQRGPGVRPRARRAPALAQGLPPAAGVLHAHDYPPVEFMRRYFDEYRGLRETIGHVEPIGVRSTRRATSAALVGADRRWMRERGLRPRASARAGPARSVVHHTGRKVFSALGCARHRAAGARAARAVARGPRRGARRAPRRRAAAAGRPAHEPPRSGSTATRRSRACCATGRRRCSPPSPAWPTASGCTSRSRSRRSRRLGRPQHHLPARASGSSGWATRARSGSTTRSASARTSGAGACCGARSSSTSRR